MAEKKKTVGLIVLKNVRLSFEALAKPEERKNDDGEVVGHHYKSNFLISKDPDDKDSVANLAKIKAAAAEVKAHKYGEDKKNWPKYRPDKLCLRDGDLETWDGYEGNYYLSSNRDADSDGPPTVLTPRKGTDGKWIRAEPGDKHFPYSGCYVNAIVRIWPQDNKHGKRINAAVESVQFLRDGDAFGKGRVNPDDLLDDDDVGEYGELGDDDAGSDDGDDLI